MFFIVKKIGQSSKNFINGISIVLALLLCIQSFADDMLFASEKGNAPKTIYMIHWVKLGRTKIGESFIQYFKEKNYNVKFVERFAMQDKKKIQEYIKEIRETKPDLIYVYSTTGVLELAGPHDATDKSQYITDIPIIAAAHSEPVTSKILKKIGVPTGRNVTGVGHHIPANMIYNIMEQYIAPIKKVCILISDELNAKGSAGNLMGLEGEKKFTSKLFYHELVDKKVTDSSIENNVLGILKEKPDIIYLPSDGNSEANIAKIIQSFAKHREIHSAPIFTTLESMVTTPGSCTFSLFTSYNVMGIMAAFKAEQILYDNKKVTEIPYELGSQMNLAIRGDTMRALKAYPKMSLLETADIFE
ncbi:MAG: ABC transporter substrate binding protein [Candidatus Paracaedibacteraceae bacterium]|nr:ABC transporter substrate binding protein [Candidatus Paracaedibacteraceae bacterium]